MYIDFLIILYFSNQRMRIFNHWKRTHMYVQRIRHFIFSFMLFTRKLYFFYVEGRIYFARLFLVKHLDNQRMYNSHLQLFSFSLLMTQFIRCHIEAISPVTLFLFITFCFFRLLSYRLIDMRCFFRLTLVGIDISQTVISHS